MLVGGMTKFFPTRRKGVSQTKIISTISTPALMTDVDKMGEGVSFNESFDNIIIEHSQTETVSFEHQHCSIK